MAQSKITHCGKVINIEDDIAFVKIEVKSACSGCHAKTLCSSSEIAEKTVEALISEELSIGDEVVVEMDMALGFKAVVFAFIIPFFILVGVIFAVYSLTRSEIKSAIIAIGSLFPYYLTLFVFKKYFKKKFIFTCRKINNISQ
ncbi:MAG: SoxR reducing system RseC family protein [bacterium]